MGCKTDVRKIKTDLDKMNLKSAVHSVSINSYYIENNKKIDPSQKIKYFNRKGRLIKSIEKTYSSATNKWEVSLVTDYNYRGDVSKRYYSPRNIVFYKYKYTKNGLKIKKSSWNKKSGLSPTIYYKYNNKNLLIKETYKKDNKVYHRAYQYDSRNNPVCQTIYLDGKEITKHYLKYNKTNKLIWSRYQSKNGVYTSKLTINHQEDVSKEECSGVSYQNEDWVQFDDFSHFEFYDGISTLAFSVNPNKYSYKSTFKYDNRNNWILHTLYFEGKKVQEETRTIIYRPTN